MSPSRCLAQSSSGASQGMACSMRPKHKHPTPPADHTFPSLDKCHGVRTRSGGLCRDKSQETGSPPQLFQFHISAKGMHELQRLAPFLACSKVSRPKLKPRRSPGLQD